MTVQAELLFADLSLRRFIRRQYDSKLGYPRQAAFAREMSRGSIRMPTPINDDPWMDCIGGFYQSLEPLERMALREFYLSGDSYRRVSKRLRQSFGKFKRLLNRLLLQCFEWLRENGMTTKC